MRWLLTVVLAAAVSLTAAGGVQAGSGPDTGPAINDVVTSSADFVGDAPLPTFHLTSFITVELDVRSLRTDAAAETLRSRRVWRTAHERVWRTRFCESRARLTRGGIDDSALGTPPPQS